MKNNSARPEPIRLNLTIKYGKVTVVYGSPRTKSLQDPTPFPPHTDNILVIMGEQARQDPNLHVNVEGERGDVTLTPHSTNVLPSTPGDILIVIPIGTLLTIVADITRGNLRCHVRLKEAHFALTGASQIICSERISELFITTHRLNGRVICKGPIDSCSIDPRGSGGVITMQQTINDLSIQVHHPRNIITIHEAKKVSTIATKPGVNCDIKFRSKPMNWKHNGNRVLIS